MISNFKKFFYPIIGLGFISVVGWVVILLKTGVSTQDFAYYWQNTAYWCYGYDLDSITAGSSLLKSAGPFLGVRILPPLRALANCKCQYNFTQLWENKFGQFPLLLVSLSFQ